MIDGNGSESKHGDSHKTLFRRAKLRCSRGCASAVRAPITSRGAFAICRCNRVRPKRLARIPRQRHVIGHILHVIADNIGEYCQGLLVK
jgi:hypothetical protein